MSSAFLHGFLKEEVHMVQPLGYVDPFKTNHVCRLEVPLWPETGS